MADRSNFIPGLMGVEKLLVNSDNLAFQIRQLGIHPVRKSIIMKVLSGIQPTGRPHWGNYFGAIQQYIQLQSEEQSFYFIANLHALTTIRDGDQLRQNSLDTAMDLLALGLDPDQATLFIQSDVPEISELCWLLMAGTPMGLLERCVSYKDKIAKGLPVVTGLFTYPVLQAADILAYDSDVVPVGCLLYTSPSPRDRTRSRMPSSA